MSRVVGKAMDGAVGDGAVRERYRRTGGVSGKWTFKNVRPSLQQPSVAPNSVIDRPNKRNFIG
jgi:hypothetical protein